MNTLKFASRILFILAAGAGFARADGGTDTLDVAKVKQKQAVQDAKATLLKTIVAKIREASGKEDFESVKTLGLEAREFKQTDSLPTHPVLADDVARYVGSRRAAASELFRAFQAAIQSLNGSGQAAAAKVLEAELKGFVDSETAALAVTKAAQRDDGKPVDANPKALPDKKAPPTQPAKIDNTKAELAEFFAAYDKMIADISSEPTNFKKAEVQRESIKKIDDQLKSKTWVFWCTVENVSEQNSADTNGPRTHLIVSFGLPLEMPTLPNEWQARKTMAPPNLTKQQALQVKPGDYLVLTGVPRFPGWGDTWYFTHGPHALHLTGLKWRIAKADAVDRPNQPPLPIEDLVPAELGDKARSEKNDDTKKSKPDSTKTELAEFIAAYDNLLKDVGAVSEATKRESAFADGILKLNGQLNGKSWEFHCKINDITPNGGGSFLTQFGGPEEWPQGRSQVGIGFVVGRLVNLDKHDAAIAKAGDLLVFKGSPKFGYVVERSLPNNERDLAAFLRKNRTQIDFMTFHNPEERGREVALSLSDFRTRVEKNAAVPNVASSVPGDTNAKNTDVVNDGSQQATVKKYLAETEKVGRIIEIFNPEKLTDASVLADGGPGQSGWLPISYFGLARGFKGDVPDVGVADGCGVRIKYVADDGFGKTSEKDRVYLLDKKGIVRGSVPTEFIKIGATGSGKAAEKKMEDIEKFLIRK